MQSVKFTQLPEEERREFRLPVDGITIDGKPLRNFLADKNADFITFSTVAHCNIENVYPYLDHTVLLPDKAFDGLENYIEAIAEIFNNRCTAYTEWRKQQMKAKTIDRLELTRKNFGWLKDMDKTEAAQGADETNAAITDDGEHCPMCGGELIRWEGCFR